MCKSAENTKTGGGNPFNSEIDKKVEELQTVVAEAKASAIILVITEQDEEHKGLHAGIIGRKGELIEAISEIFSDPNAKDLADTLVEGFKVGTLKKLAKGMFNK